MVLLNNFYYSYIFPPLSESLLQSLPEGQGVTRGWQKRAYLYRTNTIHHWARDVRDSNNNSETGQINQGKSGSVQLSEKQLDFVVSFLLHIKEAVPSGVIDLRRSDQRGEGGRQRVGPETNGKKQVGTARCRVATAMRTCGHDHRSL